MAKNPKIDIETTIPSYLAAWPSRDQLRSAHQQLTREWWRDRRPIFDLYVSQLVLQEVGAGDPIAAAERLDVLKGIAVLGSSPEADDLAADLLNEAQLPAKAAVDGQHLAIAVVNGMDFLLTWNCAHLANAILRPRIERFFHSRGLNPPIVCTPLQLMEG